MSTATEIRNSMVINNGQAKANTGFRQIVLSPQGVIRAVISAERSGERSKRCTRQVARNGDLVLKHGWYPSKWELFMFTDGELISLGANGFTQHAQALKALPKDADDWLTSAEPGESYLPAGVGWDGVRTTNDLRKEQDIRALFIGLGSVEVETSNGAENWLDGVVRQASLSPFTGLPLNWSKAAKLPKEMDSPAEYYDSSLAHVNEYTEWLLWFFDGGVERHCPAPTSGSWSTGYAGNETEYYNSLPVAMPAGVRTAIRITRGAYRTNDCSSYGCKWTLYKA